MSQDIEDQARGWWLALAADRDNMRLNEQFDAWLAVDDRHRLAWLDVLMADNAAQAQVQMPIEAPAAVITTLRSRPAPLGRWIGGFSMMALLLAMVLAAPHGSRQWQHWRADHRSAPGEFQTVSLADGSTLILSPDSAVSVHFDAATRRLDLIRGAAELTVGKDKRPLSVHHDGFVVRDIGTRFQVDESGDALRVTVSEGVVDVRRAGFPDTHRIEAGERLQWSDRGIESLPAASEGAAADPDLLVLDQVDAAQALAQFERATGQRLVLRGTQPERRWSAALPIRDAAQQDAALQSLLSQYDLRIQLRAMGVTWVTPR